MPLASRELVRSQGRQGAGLCRGEASASAAQPADDAPESSAQAHIGTVTPDGTSTRVREVRSRASCHRKPDPRRSPSDLLCSGTDALLKFPAAQCHVRVVAGLGKPRHARPLHAGAGGAPPLGALCCAARRVNPMPARAAVLHTRERPRAVVDGLTWYLIVIRKGPHWHTLTQATNVPATENAMHPADALISSPERRR